MTNSPYSSLLLAASLCLSVAACGDDNDSRPSDSGADRDGGGGGTDAGGRDGGDTDGGDSDGGDVDSGGIDGGDVDGGVDASQEAGVIPDASIGELAAQAKARLVACNIVEDGSLLALPPVASDSEKCAAGCIVNADCQDLRPAVCTNEPQGQLTGCLAGCLFQCATGETGENVFECDGVVDCDDGSDEANCDDYYFECTDGGKTKGSYQCDGEDDCGDGSDEEGCPTPFACGNDTVVPASYRCDGDLDCATGADEEGCGLLCEG